MAEAVAKRGVGRWLVIGGAILVVMVLGRFITAYDPPAAAPPPAPASKEDTSIPGPLPDSMGAQIVARYLKDPASAQYQDLTYRTRHGLPVICGEVNARNSFNGYTGFQDFVALGQAVSIAPDPMTASFAKLWNGFCVDTDADDAKRDALHKKRRHNSG